MIYFDNSATTKPYDEVLDAFVKVSREYYGNPSSLHALGVKAEQLLNQARGQVADILKVDPQEIYFTSGGTESNNLAIKGAAKQYQTRGRHIITTQIEHPSVLQACEDLSKEGYEITYLPVNKAGVVQIDDLKKAVRDDTILVTIMHVNNEVGSIQPVQEIGQWLAQHTNIIFHVDHVQGCTKVPLSLDGAMVDLCTISSHKFHGLKGTGALFIRKGIQLSPLFSGGNQEWKLRSGTENTAGIVAMAKALRMSEEHRRRSTAKIMEVKDYLIHGLSEMEGVSINTISDLSAPHIVNFSHRGMKGEVLVHALEQSGIYVSTTSACSSKKKALSKTLLAMGVKKDDAEGSIRISLSFDNTLSEAATFIQEYRNTASKLNKVIRRSK
ncbi:cysteine desulfurase family protein [Falsibacillus albus]|uniref:Cysteine desulfurase n=1 Tax=Falsibacillus albus TaxID=2478915 RepID=A0A3L7K4D6_9BACI|nr:cysteine desulfurase family protein [Falsibacillus albus]RLQ97927.1 cysteine desulfurase [Falsibacillus albus]